MSLLNLFGSDASDGTQSSRFAVNLRKATYDPLLITFNSIRTGKKKDTANKDAKDLAKPTQSTQMFDILSQKMVLASSFDSLDSAQRQTQRDATCDYVVFVPTSFEINKDVMNAFYDSKLKQLFKQKTEFNNAAANIFLNWSMFESFVIFANKKVNERQIALIEKSYDSAKKEFDRLINETKSAIAFSAKTNVPIELNELWEIIYDKVPKRLTKTLTLVRMLPYFYVYTNAIVLYDEKASVGRIPNYLPLLNSNMSMSAKATHVDYMDDASSGKEQTAAPSRNIELMPAFLMGIMTNKNLANRSELRSNKLKAIRDKTYLCTFRSTTEDSLNYEILLKRLYYKYPCFLTPSLIVPREKITRMCNDVVNDTLDGLLRGLVDDDDSGFNSALRFAVSKLDGPKNACNLICAVAVATYAHIMVHVDFTETVSEIVNQLNEIKDMLNSNRFDKCIENNKLEQVLEPARAMANSVLAAAIHQTSMFTSENFRDIDMGNAMERVIFEQFNFASFMYNNATLLSLMKYSDQAPMHENAPKHADYLKTFYKSLANGVDASAQLKEQDEFNQCNDEMLYIIHGPLYFDYEWIFRQDPSLIRHILGEEQLPAQDSTASVKEQNQWIPRADPLTENVHYINRNPPPNYPKMRFDNPTPLPDKTDSRRDVFYGDSRSTRKTWKEMYVSPEQARAEKTLGTIKDAIGNAAKMTDAITKIDVIGPSLNDWNISTAGANAVISRMNESKEADVNAINAMYNWTTPGYYRYELTATQNIATEQATYRFMQLMRPVEPGAIQDYTEPNLPTAYPPPLMFITPPMRGPTNSFMLHTWIPDLSSEISPSYSKFMTVEPNGKKSLNRGAYMEQLYKMMQLVFKTVILNARSAGSTSASSAEAKRICVKIMAIGYGSDERNLKMVSEEDKKFIGDSFFYAVRDYSMFYESNNVSVIVYYDEKTQQDVKQRYNEYTSQRESVLLRTGSSTSQSTTIDETLKLQVMPVEDFFTLKFQMGKLQLQEKDLLYFVNYCSTPRAFIGNCGECPENIEDVINQEITSSTLGKSIEDASKEIETLYENRIIPVKMAKLKDNLDTWNDLLPKKLVSVQEKIRDTYVSYKTDRRVVDASGDANNPTNVNVSWWTTSDKNAIPCNAYMSSFDEHVLILHNLFTIFIHTSSSSDSKSKLFELSIYVHTQAKKILTLLSKIKPDNIQISSNDIDLVKKALAALTVVNMSWSMDAKFATGACDGAFIPNSSVLHNPFVCTQLLDINKWQYVDFDDIASREVPETKPLPPLLKKIVDSKIQESLGVSSVSAESSAVNSSILIVSKQPSIARLMKNVKTIFENLFQKNAPLKIDGKEMVLNNYAWPEEQLYCKIRNDSKLASFKKDGGRRAIDFAELRGLRSSSSAKKCIEFPLFVVQLTLTLFEGKLSDITLLDQASLTCSSDKAMMDSNLKIVWEQMMTNLKAKEQNFTIANVFKRLGFNPATAAYDYTSYFDADPNGLLDASGNAIGLFDPSETNGTATILISCTNAATNPILRTTNSQKLKAINEEVSDNALKENEKFYNTPTFDPNADAVLPPIDKFGPYNSIRALAKIAEYFNLVEMHGVAGVKIQDAILKEMKEDLADLSHNYTPVDMTTQGARIGWNAAIQTDSTMLYVNPNVMVNGTLQDISTYLLGLKPGDKILIKTDTNADKIIDSARSALRRFGRKMKRGGRIIGRGAKKLYYYVYYGARWNCAFVLAYVKQYIAIYKTLSQYNNKIRMNNLNVFMKNAYELGRIPVTFIIAVFNGLKTVFGQRNDIAQAQTQAQKAVNDANAAFAEAQKAVDDANAAFPQAQKAVNDATTSKTAAEAKLDDAKKALIDALETKKQVDAAAAAPVLDDDFLNNIFQGVSAQAQAAAQDDVVEKQAAQDAAQDAVQQAQQAQDAAQQAQQAQAAAQQAQAAASKWNAFKNAFNESFKFELKPFPAAPVRPTYEDASKVATRAENAKKNIENPKYQDIVDAIDEEAKNDDAEATQDINDAKTIFDLRFETTQMWMVTGSPTRNTGLSKNVINIPVYYFRLRTSNLINLSGREIANNTKLKVEFQKFSKDD